jgi:hypothetical protein
VYINDSSSIVLNGSAVAVAGLWLDNTAGLNAQSQGASIRSFVADQQFTIGAGGIMVSGFGYSTIALLGGGTARIVSAATNSIFDSANLTLTVPSAGSILWGKTDFGSQPGILELSISNAGSAGLGTYGTITLAGPFVGGLVGAQVRLTDFATASNSVIACQSSPSVSRILFGGTLHALLLICMRG